MNSQKRTPAEAPALGTPVSTALPAEVVRDDWTVMILAAMMFVVPAVGVPNEAMLQDTLKSIIVSLTVLTAALAFFYDTRQRGEGFRWHAVIWLPLLLCAYALGSIAWSHKYLASVEAIRWFVFALIVGLGLNTITRERVTVLAWGIHAGAVAASVWAVMQFWTGFGLFPQGPNPGSTFVNRNFFAEFVVCALPFAAFLLARARQSAVVALLSASMGLVVVSVLMTGTRSALMGLWAQLLVLFPLVAWKWRRQFAFGEWTKGTRLIAAVVLLGTVVGLGMIPSGNPNILQEERGTTALERGFKRTQSIGPTDHSLGVRMVMWRATGRMIADRPLFGVGAGAWEVQAPLYQEKGSQIETDYYVHNEFLQVVAEYGIAGWVFAIGLLGYLLTAARRTWKSEEDAPERAVALLSLGTLLLCSNIDFPWRLAATGALFALCLGILAASDARRGLASRWQAARLPWNGTYAKVAMGATLGGLALALYITQQATQAERKLVRAARLALTISHAGDSHAERWNGTKAEVLKLVRQGIAINPHYRKLTPIVADELARWGDWGNAIWIWESVLESRPYVVAMIGNVARGYSSLGNVPKAREYLERAQKLQPDAPTIRSLQVVMKARDGDEAGAYKLAKESIVAGIHDFDLINAGINLGIREKDWPFVRGLIELRTILVPDAKVLGWLQLGHLYAGPANDPPKAIAAYVEALKATPQAERKALMEQVHPSVRERVAAQMSSSSK